MRIIQFSAENVKRLSAVEITPDGDLVIIAGRNGQGKTSVLDAIWLALANSDARKEIPKPVRDGEDSAYVTLDLGELVVTRTWTGDKTTLRVESGDGARYTSPQAMLDNFVGKLSFDPLAFSMQDEKTQLATLLSLVDLPFDPDELDEERRQLFEARTDIGRDVRAFEGQLAGMAKPDADVPTVEVSVASLVAELQAATNARSERAGLLEQRERRQRAVAQYEEEVLKARAELEATNARIALLPKTDPDVDDIQARIDRAETDNVAVRAAKARDEVADRHRVAKAGYDELSGQIAAVDERKAKGLRDAKMPLDGLSFDEAGVTYRGIPFRQCSAAERLRVSLAIAMAMNPKIRVIRIVDGSLLDRENMALIEDMAQANDYQVWIERVDDTGDIGILIEDGQATPVNVPA